MKWREAIADTVSEKIMVRRVFNCQPSVFLFLNWKQIHSTHTQVAVSKVCNFALRTERDGFVELWKFENFATSSEFPIAEELNLKGT